MANDHASPSDHHIPALDGVRGIAILLVLLFHAWRSPVTAMGWAGVDLFFVLSGFLITGILLDQRGAPDRARTFFLRRALRILPLYYGVLFAVFVIRPLFHLAVRRDDLLLAPEQGWYWSYLCAWRLALHHPAGYTFLTHFWSLSIEEQFYLLWPWVVWHTTRRQLIVVASVLCMIALGLRIYLAAHTLWIEAAYMLPVCRMDALAIGGLLALMVKASVPSPGKARLAVLAGIATVSALALLAASMNYTDRVMSTVGYTAIDGTAAAMLWLAVSQPPRWLSAVPLRLLGRYSYGLYVIHPFVNWWAVRHAPVLERHLAWYVPGVLAITVACAVISYHLFEQPFLKLKSRLASRQRMAPTRQYA